jgi:metalloendopeptidase OMA1, mitochondrial
VADHLARGLRGRLLYCAVVAALAAGCGEGGFDYGAGGEGPGHRHEQVALSAQQEVQLGDKAFQEVLAKEHPVRGEEGRRLTARVKEIGDKVFDQALHNKPLRQEINLSDTDPYGTPWDFNHREYAVLENDQINAFCLPGAKVAVFTGLMDMTKDKDDWLATVLSHEISHALAHHASERIAREQMYGRASEATAGLESVPGDDRLKLLDLLGVGSHALKYRGDRSGDSEQPGPGIFEQIRELSFDRQQESEADHIGIFLMTFAGYDPDQAVAFWEAMEQRSAEQGAPPEILSDHPSDRHRVDMMRHWAARAKAARDAWQAGNVAPPAGH